MAKIQITAPDGRTQRVEVDDSFLRLSPEDQSTTVDEIATSIFRNSGSSPSSVKTNTYDVRGPNGSIYEVTAPEGASEAEILAYAQANAGTAKPAQAKPDLGRIRSNISSMIDQGAPESDIDQYLTEEGVTAAQMRAYGRSLNGPPRSTVPPPPPGFVEVPQGFVLEDRGQSAPNASGVQSDLQRMFDSGASAQDLRTYAQQNGGYDLKGLDEAISFRDKGGKGAIVAPVQEAATAANDQFPEGYFERQEKDYQAGEAERIKNLYAPRDSQPQEGGPGFTTRQLGALNEGIADTLGAPVDIINAGMGAIGLPVSDKPFLGSGSIKDGMHSIGIGQADEGYAPRSALEKYTQAASRGVGQAVVPAGGLPALGGRAALLAKATAPVATRAETLLAKVGQAAKEGGRTLVTEAAKRPGLTVSAEVASGAGSGVGGQTARDVAPGNPYAEFAGTMIGGLAGGLGGAKVSNAARKRLMPDAYFADLHADNPHLGVDAAIANDVRRVVSPVPLHDASGRKVSAMARAATLRNRVDQLAQSYLPNVQTINALQIPPSQKRLLRNALDGALTLSPKDIDALRITPEGQEVADAILKVQRLRHYIPEGSATAPERSLAGLVADTAGVAIGSQVAGPMGAAVYRVGREAIASQLPGGAKDAAVDIKALAGRASAFRKLAETQNITIPQSIGRPLEKAANEAQDGVYLARQASKARKAREDAEALSLQQGNARIGIANDRQNIRPQGGYRGYLYERTGLLPAAQDAGAMRMVADGTMTPQQLEAFLSDPSKLQAGNAGNAILDRLASMADEGHLDRDPSWSPPAPALSEAMDASGQPIRNPLAYQAAATGKQDRVTAALNGVWNNAELDEPVKRTIGSAVSKLGSTSSRSDAESLLSSVIDELPEAHRDYGRTILQPLVSAIKASR